MAQPDGIWGATNAASNDKTAEMDEKYRTITRREYSFALSPKSTTLGILCFRYAPYLLP